MSDTVYVTGANFNSEKCMANKLNPSHAERDIRISGDATCSSNTSKFSWIDSTDGLIKHELNYADLEKFTK